MNTHGSQEYHLLGRRVHQPLINPRCVARASGRCLVKYQASTNIKRIHPLAAFVAWKVLTFGAALMTGGTGTEVSQELHDELQLLGGGEDVPKCQSLMRRNRSALLVLPGGRGSIRGAWKADNELSDSLDMATSKVRNYQTLQNYLRLWGCWGPSLLREPS